MRLLICSQLAQRSESLGLTPTAARALSLIYKENDEILGYCSLSDFNPKIAYDISVEISIYVAKKALKKGIGKQLLAHSLNEARGLNLKNVIALIFSKNEASLGLFLKFGFEKWGELPGVCLMDGEYKDVVILGLKL